MINIRRGILLILLAITGCKGFDKYTFEKTGTHDSSILQADVNNETVSKSTDSGIEHIDSGVDERPITSDVGSEEADASTTQISICEGRKPNEVFCDGVFRVVCSADLSTAESEECESIQHCQNGIGSRCAVCLSNSYLCNDNFLKKCKDDHSGWEDYQDCDLIDEPCNQEAGACTSDACLKDQKRCNGDDLEKCNADQSAFELIQNCGPGLCNNERLACDACIANTESCASDNRTVISCLADGTDVTEELCDADTPHCIGAGRCVECINDEECDDENLCTQNNCDLNSCSYPPVENDCGTQNCGDSPSGCYQCGTCEVIGEYCNSGVCETCDTLNHCGPNCSSCDTGSKAPTCGGATVGCVCTGDSCGANSRCVNGACEDCDHQCDQLGISCSNDNKNIVLCQQDENGCRIRSTQPCAYECLGGACVHNSCVGDQGDACQIGSTPNSCCFTVNIPDGIVAMGRCGDSTESCSDAADGGEAEIPEHDVMIDGFYMDIFEVTVGRFRTYVEAYDGDESTRPSVGAGSHPSIDGSGWQGEWDTMLPRTRANLVATLLAGESESTWTNAITNNELYPINRVSWFLAFAFCIWDGGRLPTEAEWEYAASGGKDENRYYPWGPVTLHPSDEPQRANCNITARSPYIDVGSYPYGVSKWGVHDLSGSVFEWALDWYASDWYLQPGATYDNSANLISGTNRVWRGGAYGQGPSNIRVARRASGAPTSNYQGTGIRCVYNQR